MGWLLDPEESCLFVYDASKSVQTVTNRDVVLPVPKFAQTIEVSLNEILGWLKA